MCNTSWTEIRAAPDTASGEIEKCLGVGSILPVAVVHEEDALTWHSSKRPRLEKVKSVIDAKREPPSTWRAAFDVVTSVFEHTGIKPLRGVS